MTAPLADQIPARTTLIEDPGDLIAWLRSPADAAWLRRGDGMVGLGVLDRVEVGSIDDGAAWWEALSARFDRASDPDAPWGSGPVVFGSFTFDPGHTRSSCVLIVPRVVIGRRDGRSWVTTLGDAPVPDGVPSAPSAPGRVTLADDGVHGADYAAHVATFVDLINDPGTPLEKVVAARAVRARADDPIDARWLAGTLASAYPTTWTYSIDGLVGASPEMLLRAQDGLATSRVLAGTIRRGEPSRDDALAAALAASDKDLEEHEFAVASVAKALRPFCSGMNVPDAPFVLSLPNVMHLASDVTAVMHPGISSLRLAGQLHPSAAVCGTPTDAARTAIVQVEGLDRGRYAGPVGWMDAAGDGEWAIALRCGRIDPDQHGITLYAGCGIVGRSVPDAELAETRAKLRPLLDALGVDEATQASV